MRKSAPKTRDRREKTSELKYNITLETRAGDFQVFHYEFFSQKPNRDYDSGAVINTVSRNEMPRNVAGFYRPDNHVITHPNDRQYGSSFDISVRAHESIHATYGTTNEYQTDCLAAAKTGHYEFVRNGINKNVRL